MTPNIGRYPVIPQELLEPAANVDDQAEREAAVIRTAVDRAVDQRHRPSALLSDVVQKP